MVGMVVRYRLLLLLWKDKVLLDKVRRVTMPVWRPRQADHHVFLLSHLHILLQHPTVHALVAIFLLQSRGIQILQFLPSARSIHPQTVWQHNPIRDLRAWSLHSMTQPHLAEVAKAKVECKIAQPLESPSAILRRGEAGHKPLDNFFPVREFVFIQRKCLRIRVVLERASEAETLKAWPPVTEGREKGNVEKAPTCHTEAGERTQATEVRQGLVDHGHVMLVTQPVI